MSPPLVTARQHAFDSCSRTNASGAKGRKLRIALSIYTFKPHTGGLQAHAEQLCRNLESRGHHVFVVTRSASRFPQHADYLFFNEMHRDMLVGGVQVRALVFSRLWMPLLWSICKCAARPRLQQLAIRMYHFPSKSPAQRAFSGADIVHHIGSASALMGFASARAAKTLGVPFVVQPTSHPFHNGDSPLDFQLYNLANRLLVHTQYEADFWKQKSLRNRITVVGNGIEDRVDGNAERFRVKFGVRGPMVLYLGRKDPDKGYPLVVEGFKAVRKRRSDVSLVCIGPASGSDRVDPTDGLLDLEFASEEIKHDALAACTCLCVPSEWESFGLVYMEAGLYGKPVIARNLPVLRELLKGGEAGLLIGTPDDEHNTAKVNPSEVASAILSLVSDQGRCIAMGQRCHRVSQEFLWPRIVERFEASYHATMAEFNQLRRSAPTAPQS